MALRRRARRAAFVVLAGATAACNALNGAHDRFLDDGDSSPPPRPHDDANVRDAAAEALPRSNDSGDAKPGVLFIDVKPPFKGLNGATFTSDTNGATTITAYDGGGANHAVLVPVTQPAIPSEDYTVYATVRTAQEGEFGILTRMQPDGSGYGFGSEGFGQANKQFLGKFAPPEWAPSDDNQAKTAYAYVPGGRYKLELKAVGNQITGKLWEATEPEPTSYQVSAIAPWSTGRGVGYYNFGLSGAVLESLLITVP